MDAAVAGLIGAATGLVGPLVVPLLTSRHARTEARRERMRAAYEDAYSSIARISYVSEAARHGEFQAVAEALARVQLYGRPRTANLFGDVVSNIERALTESDPGHLASVTRRLLIDFAKAARLDLGTDSRPPIELA